ncbi:ABC transporter ATP-binding protein [Nocardia sp. NPDC052278]|uniref:ABC transporter ATP-binding protein n=1 Tax=unclassified Nocardia TaxID=2637762 RepID=UPI0036993188
MNNPVSQPISQDEAPLSVEHLTVRYGAVVAVNDVSLRVEGGAITGLIGPNGAGKTTFIDAVSGFVPAAGRIRLSGNPLERYRPHRRQRSGLSRTFQSLELFDDLTVEQNLLASRFASGWDLAREVVLGRRAPVPAHIDTLLDRFELSEFRHDTVANLSQGHRKIVTIARAMAGDPTVLLLDEPAAGLDSTESRWLRDHLIALAETGTSILLVEHDMDLVLSACHHLYVLDFGTLIAEGTPAEISRHPAVRTAYLGAPAPEPAEETL